VGGVLHHKDIYKNGPNFKSIDALICNRTVLLSIPLLIPGLTIYIENVADQFYSSLHKQLQPVPLGVRYSIYTDVLKIDIDDESHTSLPC